MGIYPGPGSQGPGRPSAKIYFIKVKTLFTRSASGGQESGKKAAAARSFESQFEWGLRSPFSK